MRWATAFWPFWPVNPENPDCRYSFSSWHGPACRYSVFICISPEAGSGFHSAACFFGQRYSESAGWSVGRFLRTIFIVTFGMATVSRRLARLMALRPKPFSLIPWFRRRFTQCWTALTILNCPLSTPRLRSLFFCSATGCTRVVSRHCNRF